MGTQYVTERGDVVEKYVIFLDEESQKKIRFISLPEEEMMKGHVKNYNPAGSLLMFLDHVVIAEKPSRDRLSDLVEGIPIRTEIDFILPVRFCRAVNRAGQVASCYTVDLERYSKFADKKIPIIPAYVSGDVPNLDFPEFVKNNHYPDFLAGKQIKTPVVGEDLYLKGFVGWLDQFGKPRRDLIVVR